MNMGIVLIDASLLGLGVIAALLGDYEAAWLSLGILALIIPVQLYIAQDNN
jgi:hypothetical protein